MVLFYFKDILWYNITRFLGETKKSVVQKRRCVN